MSIEIKTGSKGTIRYFKNGSLHREDGPAVIWPDGSLEWYLDGYCHRTDGPAIVCPDGKNRWWFNGKMYVFDTWCRKANISDQQKTLLMLKYNIHT